MAKTGRGWLGVGLRMKVSRRRCWAHSLSRRRKRADRWTDGPPEGTEHRKEMDRCWCSAYAREEARCVLNRLLRPGLIELSLYMIYDHFTLVH